VDLLGLGRGAMVSLEERERERGQIRGKEWRGKDKGKEKKTYLSYSATVPAKSVAIE
jgi:hypothetical protein